MPKSGIWSRRGRQPLASACSSCWRARFSICCNRFWWHVSDDVCLISLACNDKIASQIIGKSGTQARVKYAGASSVALLINTDFIMGFTLKSRPLNVPQRRRPGYLAGGYKLWSKQLGNRPYGSVGGMWLGHDFDAYVRKRRNRSAVEMELRLVRIKPSIR